MNEIEIKFRVERFDFLTQRLGDVQAEFVDSVLQTDVYFDTPDDALRARGKGLRLRKIDAKESELTYKGPVQPHSQLKIRPEIQTKIADAHSLEMILGNLGYQQKIVIQKKRRTYRCGDCEVLLDELPIIGKFVEIEGPDQDAVLAMAEKLNLSPDSITMHYVSLILQEADRQGIATREFLFSNG